MPDCESWALALAAAPDPTHDYARRQIKGAYRPKQGGNNLERELHIFASECGAVQEHDRESERHQRLKLTAGGPVLGEFQ